MYYPSFNIGIEEEYQVVDPESRELLGYVTQSMAREKMVVNERAANVELADLVRSGTVQVGTPVCVDINEARDRLLGVRSQMLEVAKAGGFRLVAAGTHPFSRWEGREETLARALEMINNTCPFDASGHPSMSVPCGMIDGLPVGMMLTGRKFDEATVLRAAQAFETAGDWKSM